jgi:hypothetical protein
MTGYKKIFIDTAPFIYFIEKNEKNPEYFEKVKSFSKIVMKIMLLPKILPR